jgi:hypothetical protein
VGGYAGTPLAEVLPVVLEPRTSTRGPDRYLARLQVRPTRAGASHAVTQIGSTEEESAGRWADLPEVTSVNPIRRVKPGATILLAGSEGRRDDHVVLAHQRYGRGKAMAFTVQDSWNWQLHASVPVEDLTHETFWRQLLRWLVDGVPERIELTLSDDHVEPGEAVALTANVADRTFVEVNDGRVVAQVTAPSGQTTEVPLEWTVRQDGEYRASFTPQEEGAHEIRVAASREGEEEADAMAYLRAGPSDDEYFDAAMRPAVLQRIARDTGGRFYTAENVSSLAEDISHTGRGVTVVEERDLWDMPVLLFLMLGLVLGEWGYRRARGLV